MEVIELLESAAILQASDDIFSDIPGGDGDAGTHDGNPGDPDWGSDY